MPKQNNQEIKGVHPIKNTLLNTLPSQRPEPENERWKKLLLGGLAAAVLIAGFYFISRVLPREGGVSEGELIYPKDPSLPVLRVDSEAPYRLTAEKISKSAPIIINLPSGVKASQVKESDVKFTPEIEGKWLDYQTDKVLVFKPKEELTASRYYSAALAYRQSPETIIKTDFLAVENPEIIAVFPGENSEAPEDTEITIIFNRPMVPLTTLSELEKNDVPVVIIPETEGRFKWLTTRNLQFIPEERLQRSSRYQVQVKPGLTSMEGLEVEPISKAFTTRNLRYISSYSSYSYHSYREPITIRFNQPVDLDKTKSKIKLTQNGRAVSFIAQYGQKFVFKERLGKTEGGGLLTKMGLAEIAGWWSDDEGEWQEDKTVIEVYNKKDRFGREKLWDFNAAYIFTIDGAFPEEGDINLNQTKSFTIRVDEPIKSISAESDRTSYVEQDFFDPHGKLWVQFYEEIDLSKSKINNNKIKEMGYGEKCIEEESYLYNCQKEEDKTNIYIIFKAEEVGLGEKLILDFEEIVNLDGLTINAEPIQKTITSYPEFKVLKTIPSRGSLSADLTELVICSNTPIISPAKDDYDKYFKANLDYQLNYWSASYRTSSYDEHCPNQFKTGISYGLMPQKSYSLELVLEDVFGQEVDYPLAFITGEMPDEHLSFYHLQSSYNVTSPDKTKLTFAGVNMTYVDLSICKLSAYNFLKVLGNKPNYFSPSSISACQEIRTDKIILPERYWLKNYFTVNLSEYFEQPLGHYLLTFSHPDYQKKDYSNYRNPVSRQAYERSYLSVTNLAVNEKKINTEYLYYSNYEGALDPLQLSGLKNLYWVVDMSTLNGVADAFISLYKRQGEIFSLGGVTRTDSQGIALAVPFQNEAAAIVAKGEDSAVLLSRENQLNYASLAIEAEKIYLYTDKPIYNPQGEVLIKGIYRLGYDGSYQIPANQTVNLKVYNSKGDEVLSENLKLNSFGTFNTKMALDKSSPLGTYRACTDRYDCAYFEVKEYVPAPFEVSSKTDKAEYISKDTAEIEIQANYYFGLALEGGEVEYTLSSQDYYFDKYKGEYYKFGASYTYNYWWDDYYSYNDTFILRGKTQLENGKASISQELDFEELFEEEERGSKIIVADLTVQDAQGRAVSSQKSFIAHAGEFYLGLKTNRWAVPKNTEIEVKIKSVDTEGLPLKVNNIDLNVYKLEWIQAKRLGTGGSYHYTWERKKELVQKYTLNTNSQGEDVKNLKLSQEGSYQIESKAKDKRGNLIRSTINFYVYGEGAVSIRKDTSTNLELEAEKTSLEVGETGTVLIKSPFQKAKALIAIERGEIFGYQIKEINGNLQKYDFQVKQDYIPNVYVSALVLADGPEVKFGDIQFSINTAQKELDIEVKSNKTSYLPGERVKFDILVKDYLGQPVSAEVSVAVADLSVLALKGNPKKNPLVFFYGGFPLTVSTQSSIKNILKEVEITTKGGGGAAAPGLDELERKQRGEFLETAFWQAVVRTDDNGKAQIEFTLPDNLTTWQVETLGITKDTKLGVDYIDFLTKKRLMLVPLKPRFTVPGDEYFIGAKIFNQSGKQQKFSVSLESATLEMMDDSPKQITITSDETATVYFKVKSPVSIEKGEHRFVISAKNDDLEDTVQQIISITPNDTYEAVATANFTSQETAREYIFLPDDIIKEKGGITIKTSATLAVFLEDALNYLLGFPYGCSEQIASKLKAIAIVEEALSLGDFKEKFKIDKIKHNNSYYTIEEMVDLGLSELYNKQKWDGGFSYWNFGQSNFYLTLHVIDTLLALKQAGFNVNQTVLKEAADFAYQEVTTDTYLRSSRGAIISASYVLLRVPGFTNSANLKSRISQYIQDDVFLKERVSSMTLAYLALIVSDGFDEALKNKVYQTMDNRLDIDSRGAFLEPNDERIWHYYETTVKDTALYLKAQAADERESALQDKIVRWLLAAKEKDGSWGSTNNTLAVVEAFTDFLKWKRELDSDFDLNISLEGIEQTSFRFFEETILEQITEKMPLTDLEVNKNNTLEFEKTAHNKLANTFYYDISMKYFLPSDRILPRDEGFTIERNFYSLEDKENKIPLQKAGVGDVLRGSIKITAPKTRLFVAIEDYIPSGFEIIDLNLATEQKSLRLQDAEFSGRELRPDFQEIRNDKVFLFEEELYPGVYQFDYFVRALIPGAFIHLPAVVSEMYFPENFGRTAGALFEIE